MIPVVVNGRSCWLLNYEPQDTLRLGVRMPLVITRGLTGRTSRSPAARLPRHSQEWSALLSAADFTALRNASQLAQAEDVLAPLWPFATRVGEPTLIDTGLQLAWTADWSAYAVNPVSFAAYDYRAPLLYGFIEPPRLAALSDAAVQADFSLQEDAPAAFAPTVSAGILSADVTLATAAGWAAPVFPFVPDWNEAPQPGTALVSVERPEIGPGRRRAQVFYPQAPELVQQATFRFTDAVEAARLLAWWQRRAGAADAHWVATSQTIGRLAVTAPAGTRVLSFRDPIALGTTSYLALFAADGTIEFGRIVASTATEVTLAADLVHTWGASVTCVTPAILARHTADELALEFTRSSDGWLAAARLSWREVAAEYAPPAGETRGVTLGRTPGRAFFFQLDLDYQGAVQTWRLTNYESGAVAGGHTWEYNPCDFDRSIESLDLEDDALLVRFRYFSGGPWDNWLPGNLAATGKLTTYEAEVDAAGNISALALIATSELGKPTFDGPIVNWRALGANAAMRRTLPRQLMSRACQTDLFSSDCTLQLADWKISARVAGGAGNTLTLDTFALAAGGALPSGFGAADWFALGWVEWSVGGAPMRAIVLGSTALAGGLIVLTLGRAINVAVGTMLTAAPGCDRIGSTCRTKFANYRHFRGFENMPSVSPSLEVANQTRVGKK